MRSQLIAWWQKKRETRGAYAVWLTLFLMSLSALYRWGQKGHYQWALLQRRRSSIGVISLGSPRAGGSGKTPLVRALMQALAPDLKACIVCRGYGGSSRMPHQISADSQGADIEGDEPWMLSGFATGSLKLPVIVAPKRFAGCQLAARLGYRLAILDDGMQHYQLARDLDIGIVSSEDFDDSLLPLGRLREPIGNLSRCDWIFVRDYEQLSALQKRIIQHEWKKPWLGFTLESPHLYRSPAKELVSGELETSSLLSWSDLQDTRVLAFAGIATPAVFFDQLKRKGLEIVDSWALADHQVIDETAWLHWIEKHKKSGIEAVICTEKDLARLSPSLQEKLPWTLLWPAWEVRFQQNREIFFEQLHQKFSSLRAP